MKVGNGMGVAFGPLIEPQALDKVQEHVDDALSKGAEVILGGKPHTLGGLFEPTIMTNIDRSMASRRRRPLASPRCTASKAKTRSSSRPTTPASVWRRTSTPRT